MGLGKRKREGRKERKKWGKTSKSGRMKECHEKKERKKEDRKKVVEKKERVVEQVHGIESKSVDKKNGGDKGGQRRGERGRKREKREGLTFTSAAPGGTAIRKSCFHSGSDPDRVSV